MAPSEMMWNAWQGGGTAFGVRGEGAIVWATDEQDSSDLRFLGLTMALPVPALGVLAAGPYLLRPHLTEVQYLTAGMSFMWIMTLALVAFVRLAERRTAASIGWKPISRTWLLQAVGIGIALSLLVPVLTLAVAQVVPSPDGGAIADVTEFPWWLVLLGVVTASVTEEVLFRGYALERLMSWTGSPWWSGLISLTFFTALHVPGWNLLHVIGVVMPLGVAVTFLYLWRRNLVLVMVVHLFVNLPLVFFSLEASAL